MEKNIWSIAFSARRHPSIPLQITEACLWFNICLMTNNYIAPFCARIDTFLILVGTGALPHNYHLVLQLKVQTVYQQLYMTQWQSTDCQTWKCSSWVFWASWQSSNRCRFDPKPRQRSSHIWTFLKQTGSLHRYLHVFSYM